MQTPGRGRLFSPPRLGDVADVGGAPERTEERALTDAGLPDQERLEARKFAFDRFDPDARLRIRNECSVAERTVQGGHLFDVGCSFGEIGLGEDHARRDIVNFRKRDQFVDHCQMQRRPVEGRDHRDAVDVGRHRLGTAARGRARERERSRFARVDHDTLVFEARRANEIAGNQRHALDVLT